MPPATKPLWQRFLVFLVPLMLSNILQSLSGTINNVFIGQMIGVDALAAVSTFFPIMFMLMSFIVASPRARRSSSGRLTGRATSTRSRRSPAR